MKEYDDYPAKGKKQLVVCQCLITEKGYLLQEEIRRDLQNHGSDSISQSTVSRLLKLSRVIEIRNTKGRKTYSVNPRLLPTSDTGQSVTEMVLSVEYNGEFILIHTVVGYDRAVARTLDFHALSEILGAIVGSNTVWVAPRVARRTALVYKQINCLLRLNTYS